MGNKTYRLVDLITVVSIILGYFCQNAHTKRWTTDDAVVFENDPPKRLGPSIFDYGEFSNSPKVKRGNDKKPERYYEMIDDEVYVFEPSSMGAGPFMEAMQPEEPQSQKQQVIEHQEVKHQQHVTQHHPMIRHQPQISQQPMIRHQQPIIMRHQPYKIYNPLKQKVPLYMKALHFNKLPFLNENEENIQSQNTAPLNLKEDGDVHAISHSEVTSVPEGDCFTQTDKEGQCAPFRICYPVVFNAIDGQLRNPGLAKILYKASGPCERNNSLTGWEEVQKVPTDNDDPSVPIDFYNDTVCCSGLNEINAIPQESRVMKPSLPDPEYHPHPSLMQFQVKGTGGHLMSELGSNGNANSETDRYIENDRHTESERDSDPDDLASSRDSDSETDSESDADSESGSDYYVDEYDEHQDIFKTTEIPRINPKTINNSTIKAESSNSSETGSSSGNSNAVIADESSRSEVKIVGDITGKSSKSNNDKHKSKGKLVKSQEGPVPAAVLPPPHMSAWNCPGRQIAMPRGHWPWMVALLNEGSHFCTGSLIDHRHILTSATCINSFQGKDIGKLRVILGDRVLYSSIDGPHIWRKIVRITRHIQYNPMTMEHDLAMLEMDMSVSYTPNIQPINLPTSDDRSHVTKAIISGWSGPDIGKQFFAPRTANDAIVDFMDIRDCRLKYDGFISGGLPHDLICTKPSNSSCGADPGAPLMMKTDNCWHIIGILSNGMGCGTFPEIYTDTARHMAWIQKNIRQHATVHEKFRPV